MCKIKHNTIGIERHIILWNIVCMYTIKPLTIIYNIHYNIIHCIQIQCNIIQCVCTEDNMEYNKIKQNIFNCIYVYICYVCIYIVQFNIIQIQYKCVVNIFVSYSNLCMYSIKLNTTQYNIQKN